MGLKERLKSVTATKPDHYSSPSFGASSFPFGGTIDGNPVVDFSGSLIDIIRSDSVGGAYGEIYRRQPAVRICVNFLAYNIAHLKLKSYRRTEDSPETLRDHPLPRLLARPNSRTTGFDLIRGTVADIGIYDTAYWLKRREGPNRLLFRIPPTLLTPMGGNILEGPDHYELQTQSGAPVSFDPDEIVDFSGYNPNDPRVGSPPLESLRNIIAEEVEASRHRRGFWRHAARVEGWFERAGDLPALSDVAYERMKVSIYNQHSGADNAGTIGLLEEGTKFNPAAFSPKDTEFILGREWGLDITATVYNIPLAALSRTKTPTYASAKEFHKMLYVDTLGPINARLEGRIMLQLVPDFGDDDLYVEFNIEEKLQGDFETQAEAIRSHVQVPDMSVNESRKLQGLPRVGDPAFDVPARPQNYSYEGDPEPEQPQQGQLQLAPAASNGHRAEIPSADELELIDLLEGK